MFRKKYCVYEVDTFLDTEISLKRCFRTRIMAAIYKLSLGKRMGPVNRLVGRRCLSYRILKCNKSETFSQAYERQKKGIMGS